MNGLHVSVGEVYQREIATLKKYREDHYKITLHKMMRRAGYEESDEEADDATEQGRKNRTKNTGKLEQSLSRTRSTIFELALCNDWEWFVTMTLNSEFYDRKDLGTYKKKLSTWLKNYNRIHETDIRYLLIPEQHSDRQSWHMHGLMMGLPEEHLHEFKEQEKLPIQMIIEMARGRKLFNWPSYAQKFGYVSLSKIRSIENTSKYITKYITKDLTTTKIEKNKHFYYCSKGLKRAEMLYKGPLTKELDGDYSNDYVKIKTVQSFDEAITYFVDE